MKWLWGTRLPVGSRAASFIFGGQFPEFPHQLALKKSATVALCQTQGGNEAR